MNNTALSPAPPEGFVQAMDPIQQDLPADYYDGPTETGDGWQIETTYTVEHGVEFELNADYSQGGMTPAQAIAAGTALAALASKYAVTA
ncbi:hypothetical protein [Arthrobacter sp. TB 26]|uniref:hypothetical protein n=1 Tax=Arthrobacter sp. TB 26 TaxID=494420 RepID=UPI0003F521F0|nr:hypothetical protein [Arthrobacter sp. TB 26]